MIRIGVCAPVDKIGDVERYGYDYIEGNLTVIAGMAEEDFAKAEELVRAAGIAVETCNCLMPGSLKVTGPDVDAAALHDYFERAFSRAKKLGAQVVVFGSGASRNVPEGFPIDVAWRQIVNFLRLVERHAAEHGLTVAIEPLHRTECNIINMVTEATLLAAIVQMSRVKVLGDTYHMAKDGEPLSALSMAGPLLAHVHTSETAGRKFPRPDDGEDYTPLFRALKAGGYAGRVSVEGGCDNFEEDAPLAYQTLAAARDAI